MNSRVIVTRRCIIWDKKTTVAMSSVLQHCRMVDLRGALQVQKDIGQEGWAALREALSQRLHDIPHLDTCLKINLASARKEDLRAIWECVSLSWKSSGDDLVFEKQRGEEGWIALEEFLDLTNEEWEARKAADQAEAGQAGQVDQDEVGQAGQVQDEGGHAAGEVVGHDNQA